MNINKLLQHVFYPLFLTITVGLLLDITITYHLPAMTVWGILAITTAIVCAPVSLAHLNNQKEEEK